MSKQYKCVTAWVRHSKGTIIPEHEYNKLPHEIKQAGSFVEVVEVPDTVVPVVKDIPEVVYESPIEVDSPVVVDEEPIDPALSNVIIDPFNNDRKNKNNRR